MQLPCLLQDGRPLDIGIEGLAQGIQLVVPELLVLGKALLVIGPFQILVQHILEDGQVFRIGGAEFVVGIKLHQVIDHHHQPAGIDQPVIHMDEESVVALRELYHGHIAQRDVVPLKGFVSPLLHQLVRLGEAHAGQILKRDIPCLFFYDILFDVSIFIRLRKADPHTAVTLEFQLETFFQKPEIQRRLQGRHNADA